MADGLVINANNKTFKAKAYAKATNFRPRPKPDNPKAKNGLPVRPMAKAKD